MKKRYRKCCKCGKLATWTYMPSGDGQRWYCEDCVSQGVLKAPLSTGL